MVCQVVADVTAHEHYDPSVDAPEGLDVKNMMVCQLSIRQLAVGICFSATWRSGRSARLDSTGLLCL